MQATYMQATYFIHCSVLYMSHYLISIELSFLAESWRHVLGLDLLLGHEVLVLVEKMLVLNLSKVMNDYFRKLTSGFAEKYLTVFAG